MSNNVEHNKIKCNDETFTRGTYNGISVIIRDKDGFINATDMCKQFNKRFAKINENHAWQAYYDEFKREYSALPILGGHTNDQFSYVLNKGLTKELNFLRGTYVDPRLINYIAFWASPKYAITVGKIMDSINDKVHDALKEKELDDTAENAKPVFIEVAKQIAPSVQTHAIEQQCWSVRDKAYELDCWEKDELRTVIENYQRIKEDYEKVKQRLDEQEKKVDEFGIFVKQYHPEFQK